MATIVKKEHRCPECGKIFQVSMHATVLPGEHPELRKSILSETFFSFTCPNCGYQADMVYPVLYHDREAGYMIYLSAHPEPALSQKVPQELSDVRKRVVRNQKELKEKILIFDAELDDTAIEIVKLAVLDIIAKKYGDENARAFFQSANEETVDFAVLYTNYTDPVIQSAGVSLYRQAQELLEKAQWQEKNRFLKVDQTLARSLISQAK